MSHHLYSFGEFCLDADENSLKRGSENISLTPKMYDLLLVLVENHGRIVDKEFLLKSVWPDSFVEEGNITFNIRQLRKALGDNKQSPIYIETIPRRGYRFVAAVEEIREDPAESVSPVPGSPDTIWGRSRSLVVPLTALFTLLLAAVVIGAWFVQSRDLPSAPILAAPFDSEKLSTTGNVSGAAISPDGSTMVYTNRAGTKQSVWLRHLDSASNVPLIPPSDDNYYLFTFAPDGKSIYYSRSQSDLAAYINIYRISIHGGIPELIVSRTEGWIGVSPDGGKISFVRCPRTDAEWCSLWMADSDGGKNERKLVSRTNLIRIADNQISPDGTKIAFAAGHSRTAANEFQLFELDIQTGAEREITAERFFNIKSLAWLPDGSGLLFTASRIQNKHFRIWRVGAVSGEAEPLTKDSEAYGVLSLDREAKRLVATQVKQDFKLNIFSVSDVTRKSSLANAGRATFAPDGKIYFTPPGCRVTMRSGASTRTGPSSVN